MPCRAALLVCLIACLAPVAGAQADLRDDIAGCAKLADDRARLACFDAIELPPAAPAADTLDTARKQELQDALNQEFRFSPELRTGPYTFRIGVTGDLRISRETAAAREVERLVRRIAKAFDSFDDWGVAVTVHGSQVALSRGNPYSGAELSAQATQGLERSGLPRDRYRVTIGDPAQPRLWDDGRIRDANEHIDVAITGIE